MALIIASVGVADSPDPASLRELSGELLVGVHLGAGLGVSAEIVLVEPVVAGKGLYRE